MDPEPCASKEMVDAGHGRQRAEVSDGSLRFPAAVRSSWAKAGEDIAMLLVISIACMPDGVHLLI